MAIRIVFIVLGYVLKVFTSYHIYMIVKCCSLASRSQIYIPCFCIRV